MGKRTVLSAEEFDLGTGNVLAAFRTAAAGSAASIVRVTRIEIFQNGSTTLDMVRVAIGKRDTAGTFTMTSTTPNAVWPTGAAASGLSGNTAPVGGSGRSGTNSSADSGGTYTDYFYANFANLNGWLFKPDPKEEILIPADSVFVVRFTAAPASTLDWGISIYLEED